MRKLLYRDVFEEYQMGEGPNGEPEQQLIGWDVQERWFDVPSQQDVDERYFTGQAPPPEAQELEEGAFVHAECGPLRGGPAQSSDAETTHWTWTYTRVFRSTLPPDGEINATSCGYVAPSCDLTAVSVVLSGRVATVEPLPTGGRGPLRYSLDGGLTTQSSPSFLALANGRYIITVLDTGTPNCKRSSAPFAVADAVPVPPPLPPSTLPQSLSLVLRPVQEEAGGYAPGALVRLELWVERLHRAADYQLVYEAEKVAGSDGRVSFRLDGPLLDQLLHDVPSPEARSAYFPSRAIRNYYTRRRTVNRLTSSAGPAVNGPVRTALLAGFYTYGRFLTTQPATKTVAATDPELLYYLNPSNGPDTVRVRRTVVLSGGQQIEAFEDVNFGAGQGRFRLMAIPVFSGPQPPGLEQVRVAVVTAEGQMLAREQVYLVRAAAGRRRIFLFDNPAGGIDTLVATGKRKADFDVKAEYVEREGLEEDLGQQQRGVFALSQERRITVPTGWLSDAQRQWLQVLALTRVMWQVPPGGGELQPIVLLKRRFTYQRDAPQLEGYVLEYELGNETMDWQELDA